MFRNWIRQDEADRGERSDRPTSSEQAELTQLRKENAELRRTNEILKAASAFFAQEADPSTRRRRSGSCRRIRTLSGSRRCFGGCSPPESTYYGWLDQQRHPAARDQRDAALTERIEAIHEHSGGTYGAPRVHAQLGREGIHIGRKRVERLMHQAGVQGAYLRTRTRPSPAGVPETAAPAADLVDRDFTASAPNRLWVADLSHIPTSQGPVWLAIIRDAFSRRIVGWKTSDQQDTNLVLGALEYAFWGRDTSSGHLAPHSDRGSAVAYTAIRFTRPLADLGIQPSVGSVGDSYDNALAENFFATIKTELVYRCSWRTREEAELALFRYIDGWYNPQRIQRGLGWLSPDEYEANQLHHEPSETK